MEQSEIKGEADRALRAIRAAQGEVDVARARLRVIQMQCDHPNTFRTSHMGDPGTRCPDCGHST